jgi:hypothetical protein
MTRYYLEVLKSGISINVVGVDQFFPVQDHSLLHSFEFSIGDIICIHMYMDKGPHVVLSGVEYYAKFIFPNSNSTYSVSNLIIKGYLVDITKNVRREEKLNKLGIC